MKNIILVMALLLSILAGGCAKKESFQFQVNNRTESEHAIGILLFDQFMGEISPDGVRVFDTPEYDVSYNPQNPKIHVYVTAKDMITGVSSDPKEIELSYHYIPKLIFRDADFKRKK